MKLTSKQRQLVKEYIKKIQTKKKLNEGNVNQNKIYRYFGNDPDFIIDQILDYLDFLLEDMDIDSFNDWKQNIDLLYKITQKKSTNLKNSKKIK